MLQFLINAHHEFIIIHTKFSEFKVSIIACCNIYI